MCVGASTFLSTPSARRATKPEWAKSLKGIISIHALREEGDHPPTKPKEARHDFYPRPPRGGRLEVSARVPPPNRFLSTPSARRATLDNGFVSAAELFLSTPSARRATRMPRPPAADLRISIHALREEGDKRRKRNKREVKDFYPRPPRGGRRTRAAATAGHGNFYPRPPRGGRPWRR